MFFVFLGGLIDAVAVFALAIKHVFPIFSFPVRPGVWRLQHHATAIPFNHFMGANRLAILNHARNCRLVLVPRMRMVGWRATDRITPYRERYTIPRVLKLKSSIILDLAPDHEKRVKLWISSYEQRFQFAADLIGFFFGGSGPIGSNAL